MGEKTGLRLTPAKQQCFVRLSVRQSVSGWRGGDFQVELTRTRSLRYGSRHHT